MKKQAKLRMDVKLKEDKNGIYKRELVGEFEQKAAEVKFALKRGLAPQEFKQLSLLLRSIEAASDTVERVWQQSHYIH